MGVPVGILHPPDLFKEGIYQWAAVNDAKIVLQAWGTPGVDGSYGADAYEIDAHLTAHQHMVAVVASGSAAGTGAIFNGILTPMSP